MHDDNQPYDKWNGENRCIMTVVVSIITAIAFMIVANIVCSWSDDYYTHKAAFQSGLCQAVVPGYQYPVWTKCP